MKRSINIKDTVLDFTTPKVMGILNVTPDSFSDGGKFDTVESAVMQATKLHEEGALILDIGGYSSRPGALDVSADEEISRVLPVIEKVSKSIDVVISIDTFRSEVAKAAVSAGAHIVNDISAGEDDAAMISTVAALDVPYIAMHKQGVAATMQENPTYSNVVEEVVTYLQKKVDECNKAGISDVIVDPGFGFGKTIEHNYTLLKEFGRLRECGVPILAGLSRKSMIYKVLECEPSEAINGTTFLHSFALTGGAGILRVHDVRQAVECVDLWKVLNYR